MKDLRSVFGGLVVLTAIAAGCGSSSTGTSSGGTSGTTGTSRTGVTQCGGQSCQAGQYCLNLLCSPGCGSDDNCAGNQTCQKDSGQDIGSCQGAAATKDCTAYVKKCTTCGESSSDCTKSCDVITADCISCVVNTSGCSLDSCKSLCTGK